MLQAGSGGPKALQRGAGDISIVGLLLPKAIRAGKHHHNAATEHLVEAPRVQLLLHL